MRVCRRHSATRRRVGRSRYTVRCANNVRGRRSEVCARQRDGRAANRRHTVTSSNTCNKGNGVGHRGRRQHARLSSDCHQPLQPSTLASGTRALDLRIRQANRTVARRVRRACGAIRRAHSVPARRTEVCARQRDCGTSRCFYGATTNRRYCWWRVGHRC